MLRGCALVAVVAAIGCRGQSVKPRQPTQDRVARFPHAQHTQTTCTSCHTLRSVLSSTLARPGANDHAPCDSSGCHREAFMTVPGPLCELCHQTVNIAKPNGTPLAPYPPTAGARSLAARFSHAQHLDYATMESHVGFHITCSDCHAFDQSGRLERPGHAVCSRCHSPESVPPGAPSMTACRDCHRPRTSPPTRQRKLIVGDLLFQHARHRQDMRGNVILCSECHSTTQTVQTTGTHSPPSTQECVACHNDSRRTPVARRMRMCGTCHVNKTTNLSTLAPRSHLPPARLPANHTLAFRKDHALDARSRPRQCAGCHTFMSGAARDVCDECHQSMRPRDHIVTWREYDHGPEAATKSDRCATCHVGTFCSSCHARVPRSHFPLSEFRSGGHGGLARFGMRTCVTCHTPVRDCSPCHELRAP